MNTETNVVGKVYNTSSGHNTRLKADEPEWLQKFEIRDFSKYALDVYGGVKYLLINEQLYLDDNKTERFYHTVRQVINMQGVEECSDILLEYHPQLHNVSIHAITIYRDGSSIDKLPTADIQVLQREHGAEQKVLSGDLTLSIVLDDVRPGDIIEFKHTITFTELYEIEFFNRLIQLEYGVPVYQWYFSIISNNKLRHKFLGCNYEMTDCESNGKHVYELSQFEIPKKDLEGYRPYWDRVFNFMQICVSKSWHDIAVKNMEYYSRQEVRNIKLLEFISNMKSQELSDEKIVLNALRFVHKTVRYLANYKATDFFKPTNPNITIARAYGDCKDFVYLLQVIISEFNIKSYPVLVHSRYGRELNNLLPTMYAFNHAIILIEVNGQSYFIDPTIKQDVSALNRLYFVDYGYGLVCSDSEQGLRPIKNSEQCINKTTVTDEYQINLWDTGEVLFAAKVIVEGSEALRLINALESQPLSQIEDAIRNYYKKHLNIIETLSFEVDDSQRGNNMMSFSVKYKVLMKTFVENNINYLGEICPIDIFNYIDYLLPEKISTDFYFGVPSTFDYQIKMVDQKTKFSGDQTEEIVDDAFKLVKKTEGTHGEFRFKYYFENYYDVVTADKYNSFSTNYARARGMLRDYIKKPKEIKKNRFVDMFFSSSFLFKAYMVILVLLILSRFH